jgi:hypothetical protein
MHGYEGGYGSIIGNNGRDRGRGGATSSGWESIPAVHLASRSRKGYWRMSQNSLVLYALNNTYLKEQGVPELREIWIRLHYGDKPKSTGKAG